MRAKSVLSVVAVLLCTVAASAQQSLEKELQVIDNKVAEIRELLSDSNSYRPLKAKELDNLECRQYGKSNGVISSDDRGSQVYTDAKGVQFTNIKDYYYPVQVVLPTMILQESTDKKMLVALVNQGNIFASKLCAVSMAKVGYRYIGELACEKKGDIVEASVHSPKLEADSYFECTGPTKLI